MSASVSGLSVGDAVLRFLADTSDLDGAFTRLNSDLPGKLKPSADAAAQLGKSMDAVAQSAAAAAQVAGTAATQTTAGLNKSVDAGKSLAEAYKLLPPAIAPSNAALQNMAFALRNVQSVGQAAAHETSRSFSEARGTIALLGEDIGVRLPRHLQTFLAGLPGVSGILGAAFAPVAIITLIDFIGKLIEQHERYKAALLLAANETRNITIAETTRTEGLQLANLQLQDSITKLEGGVARNRLAEALLEAKSRAEQLATTLAADFEKAQQLLVDESGYWKTLANSIEDVTLAIIKNASIQNLAPAAEKAAGANVALQQSLKGVLVQLNAVEEARLQLNDAKSEDQQKAAIVALQLAYNALANNARAAVEVVQTEAPKNIQLISTLRNEVIQASAGVRDTAEEFKNLTLAAQEANKATANDVIAKQARKDQELLSQQIEAITKWKESVHDAFQRGTVDAATWEVAQVHAAHAADIAHEEYLANLQSAYAKAGDAAKAQEVGEQLATLQAQNANKATKELKDATDKYHEVTLKILKDWQDLEEHSVAKNFEQAQRAAKALAAAELQLADAQAKLAQAKIQVDYSQQEAAIQKLADLSVITEQEKADQLKELYAREENDAVEALQIEQDKEHELISQGQQRLTAAQASGDQVRIEEAQAYLDTLLAKYDETLAKILSVQHQFDAKYNSTDEATLRRATTSWNSFFRALLTGSITTRQQLQIGFQLITEALGQSIAAAVEGQQSFVGAIEQMAKGTLAALAAEAIVQALYNTAWGFYYLAHHDYVGATDSFEAAAVFGAVGGAAAAAGAAIPSGSSSAAAGSSGSSAGATTTTASPAQTPAQQPVSVVNAPRLAAGALVTQQTLALVGDSRSGGRAREGILPLDDPQAMDAIAGEISERIGANQPPAVHHHNTWNIHGIISDDNLAKVTKKMTQLVNKGQARLGSSNTFRVTKRG